MLLAILMIFSAFASCKNNQTNETEGTTGSASTENTEGTTGNASTENTEGTTGSASTENTEGTTGSASTENTEGTTGSASTENTEGTTGSASTETTENTANDSPMLEGKDSAIIEVSNELANGVNAYFSDGNRTNFVTENKNMLIAYSTDMLSERKVTALTDKNGNPYITNTMDVFVKMKDGGTYYTSGTANSAKVSQFAGLNIFRYGYYYYDVRIEDQNFVNDVKVIKELDLDIKTVSFKEGLKTKFSNNTLTCYFIGNSVDPRIVFGNINYNTSDYDYLAITMKSDLPSTNEADCQFFFKTDTTTGYKNVSFDTINDGEYHTYYVYLGNNSEYSGNLTELRLDLSMSYSTSGSSVSISSIKAVKADVNGAPQSLGVARVFHTYSDKLHQELQFAAKNTTAGIEEVGIITTISADTVAKLIIKDKNGTHDNIDGIDYASVEYVGFDIKEVGVFGYILPYNSTDKLYITLNDGIYTIIQSATPEGGVIYQSESGTDNANDFRMGHRIYTDQTTASKASYLKRLSKERLSTPKHLRFLKKIRRPQL